MRILLTGVTGYIGKRLLPVLLSKGHEVICCVRDKARFNPSAYRAGNLKVIEVDFLNKTSLSNIPHDIDAAYYLIHSMSSSVDDFDVLEKETAQNFKDYLQTTKVKQVIYLSGIINTSKLSKHLSSRKAVEEILDQGTFALTTLRAGIIVGSGSASFEIIRDLVEKLPIMIAPRWLKTKSQPIAIRNVLQFLQGVLLNENIYNRSFDIGGPEVLTYKDMLLRFAAARRLKRRIFNVPVMTPKLSSYWLYFITSTSYKLAVNLVNSMKVEIICSANDLHKQLNIELLSYEEAIQLAFDQIEQQEVVSSWTDAQSSETLKDGVTHLINVPVYGCFKDIRSNDVTDENETINRIWSIGGVHGWYYANWLWSLRGFLDKVVGGVGLRRGRTNQKEIYAGDSLDFWRVIYANKNEKRLLLYAEMKLPGEAWLEFKIENNKLLQTATFRPLGIWGRLYWFIVFPIHELIFGGMIKRIAVQAK
ncbi:MAG: SDR family oxidoreductase [Flammeovirgaceae bacterium]|nr:SDR family oxidoreductase [Flammeovirgaceae bacterium]